jgi:hypothetical protein
MKIFIGVDNGLQGGLVAIDEGGRVLAKHPGGEYTLKNKKTEYVVNEMASVVMRFKKDDIGLVVVEKAQAYPGQGVCSQLSVGYGHGLWVGILSALGFPVLLVHPKTWQKEILKDMDRTDTKAASILFAQRMSPETDWRGTERSKKMHDGLCDAFCMAIYAKRLSGE